MERYQFVQQLTISSRKYYEMHNQDMHPVIEFTPETTTDQEPGEYPIDYNNIVDGCVEMTIQEYNQLRNTLQELQLLLDDIVQQNK